VPGLLKPGKSTFQTAERVRLYPNTSPPLGFQKVTTPTGVATPVPTL
jgi:hypothetical protein